MEKTKKILIAEDEKPMAKALQLKLSHEGYEVDIVATGNEAIAFLEKNKYDLILLDIMMPELDGFGVLEWMNDNKNSTPTIVSSNLGQSEDVAKAKKLGAVDYFVKSDTPIADIVDRVKKII